MGIKECSDYVVIKEIYLIKSLLWGIKECSSYVGLNIIIRKNNMKIAFFGTGEFSKNILTEVIWDSRVEVKLVVSQPDKPVWRKKVLEKTPVKLVAEENNIKILQPEKLLRNSDFLDSLDSLELDFILVVAYGKIVPKRVLNSAKYWCINLHGSILPKYRGASPIQEAIKNWDTETGLTVMFMSKAMDEWDILEIQKISIEWNDTTEDIFKKFENFWANLAIDVLTKIKNGDIKWIKQDEIKATYCSKINKQDWVVDFFQQSSSEIYNTYRAYKTWPWIHCFYNKIKLDIEECKIYNEDTAMQHLYDSPWQVIKINKKSIWIVCWDKKILILKQVKLAWKKSMDILSFINGNRDFLNYKF